MRFKEFLAEETKTLEFKIKESTKNGLDFFEIKNGAKLVAKIYPPNQFHKSGYKIEISGLSFGKKSLEDAIEFVKNNQEEMYNAFSTKDKNYKVVIKK